MSAHLTKLRATRQGIAVAWCEEHHRVGLAQKISRTGLNALVTEAQAHDDIYHATFRPDAVWADLLSSGRAWGEVVDFDFYPGH